MRILHVVPTYTPAYRYGGPIVSVHELNKALVTAGIDVTVYTTNLDGPALLDVPTGVPVMRDGVRIFYFPVSFPRTWSYSRELHRALRKTAATFDLIHITSAFLAASTLGAFYAQKAHVPYLISPRGSLMERSFGGKSSLKKKIYSMLIEKKNLSRAAAIHVTGEKEEREYRALGLPARRVIVIPNGIARERFDAARCMFRTAQRISPDAEVVLHLGRLSWIKGFDTLIPAMAEAVKRRPHALLVIAGGDDEGHRAKIEKLINLYHLSTRVMFTGMLLGAEKACAFHESDVFVLASYSENFGIAAVEAMHYRKPVVVTEGVGIAPQIGGAGAGIVTKKDESKMADAIIRLLENATLRASMGAKGAALAQERFSPESMAKSFLALYTELIQHGNR